MKRSEIEQLTDEIIGEAVLSLLTENSPINLQALVMRLQSMEASASDYQRQDIIARVIAEVTRNSSEARRHAANESGKWDSDNVHQLFGNRQPTSNRKKH